MRLFLPAGILVVVDQITKQLFWRIGENYDVIPGLFRITLVKNAGAAFGMFQGGRLFFVFASLIAIAFIIRLESQVPLREKGKHLLLGIILGGAIGNLIDRVYAGQVIDFLEIGVGGHWWPVFNVADMGVSIGATLLVLSLIRRDKSDGSEVSSDRESPVVPTNPVASENK